MGVTNLIAIALLRAQAAGLGIWKLAQKGSLRLSCQARLCPGGGGVRPGKKYKGRLLFNAGEKPYLALRLKKGDNVLKLAGIV